MDANTKDVWLAAIAGLVSMVTCCVTGIITILGLKRGKKIDANYTDLERNNRRAKSVNRHNSSRG